MVQFSVTLLFQTSRDTMLCFILCGLRLFIIPSFVAIEEPSNKRVIPPAEDRHRPKTNPTRQHSDFASLHCGSLIQFCPAVSKAELQSAVLCQGMRGVAAFFLASVVREPKCHFILIFNNWNCKCTCEVSGNGNGNEYETRAAEVQRRRMKKGWKREMMIRLRRGRL